MQLDAEIAVPMAWAHTDCFLLLCVTCLVIRWNMRRSLASHVTYPLIESGSTSVIMDFAMGYCLWIFPQESSPSGRDEMCGASAALSVV